MLESIIAGVISGVIASAILYFVFSRIRPKVVIVPMICVHDGYHWLKIINKTKADLINADYVLTVCNNRRDNNYVTHEIATARPKVRQFDAYSKRSSNHEYALQVSYELNPDADFNDEANDFYRFTVCAMRPFFGTSIIVRQDFKKKDIVSGYFSPGDTMEFVQR